MAPTALYSRLKAYYTGEKEPEIPHISTATAIAILVLYTLIYVLPFYISSTTRPSATLSRDAPSVIRGRIRSVTVSCIICIVFTFVFLSAVDNGSPINSLHRMGFFPVGVEETGKALLLTAILFAGPLFEAGIAEGGWRNWIRLRGFDQIFGGWIGYRNFVAGPITEEILFRSCSVPLLLLSQTANSTIVFLTPIVFGLAHVHHFYEFRIQHPHTPLIGGILRSVLQFSYTTLFGSYATFIYMRTGSVLACTIVHAFCNWMGLPRFWGRVNAGETVMGPDFGESKRDEGRVGLGQMSGNGGAGVAPPGQLGIGWSISYYALMAVGAVAWYKYLWTLTESESALAMFE